MGQPDPPTAAPYPAGLPGESEPPAAVTATLTQFLRLQPRECALGSERPAVSREESSVLTAPCG